MSRRNENWLLVEWSAGGRDVIHVKSVLSPVTKDVKIGDVMTVNRQGEPHTATLIARAKVRDQLDPRPTEEAAGPSPKPDEEPADFSPSGSSWAPSDDGNVSEDSEPESSKKIKLEHCRQYINRRRSKKILTPSHRANAVIPKIMQDARSKKNDVTRKRAHNEISRHKSSLPDSTKRYNTPQAEGRHMVTIDARELAEISNSFRVLFNMIEDLKRPAMTNFNEPHVPLSLSTLDNNSISITNDTVVHATEECENDEYEIEEEFNRSDDNVLITNKYDTKYNTPVNKPAKSTSAKKAVNQAAKDEWIPIGSGKTLIHSEQFRKVNWKSYTVATRTLLLAVFPRRILATHSLTGKPSPAFMNKPAKMCLDPKIISDVIMEIVDRFDVKENLVRGIITTKCADECKMLRQRVKKKKSQSRSSSNQENEPAKGSFVQNSTVA